MKNQVACTCNNGKILIPALGKYVACPKCSSLTALVQDNEKQTKLMQILNIPHEYTDIQALDVELFDGVNLGMFSSDSIQEVQSFLKRINTELYNGNLLRTSAYIHTTSLVDIRQFVYGSQKLAFEKEMSIVPFISLNTLHGVQKLSDYSLTTYKTAQESELKNVPSDLISAVEGYRFVQDTNTMYYDYIHADIVFLEATANTTERGWTALADLLAERSRYSLPTYVIGYWGSNSLQTKKSGLRYLINNGERTRLDLLEVFELKSNNSMNFQSKNKTTADKIETTKVDTTTKKSVGVSVNTLMG